MSKVVEVLTSTRLWTAVVATGAVFYTTWTGNEVTPEQLAKVQTTVLAIVSIASNSNPPVPICPNNTTAH